MPDTGSPYNLPYPDLDDIPDIPSDFKGLADRVSAVLGGIDADDPANLVGLPTTGQPLAFYGSGRPDAAGLDLSAPVGSTYTFTGSESELEAVFGAQVWRKGTDWVCVEGNTGQYAKVNGSSFVKVRRTDRTQFIEIVGVSADWVDVPAYDHAAWAMGGNTHVPAMGVNNTGTGRFRILGQGIVEWKDKGGNRVDLVVCMPAGSTWPSAPPWDGALRVDADYLRELIEAAQDPDHPNHDQLLQLKDELAELTGTRPGDGGA